MKQLSLKKKEHKILSETKQLKEDILQYDKQITNETKNIQNQLKFKSKKELNSIQNSPETFSSSTPVSPIEQETEPPIFKKQIKETITKVKQSQADEPHKTNLPKAEDHKFDFFGMVTEEPPLDYHLNPNSPISSEQTFTVTYWMFYSYNSGKKVCSTKFWGIGRIPKMLVNGTCLWDEIMIGDHVGDWEHTSIFFKVFDFN